MFRNQEAPAFKKSHDVVMVRKLKGTEEAGFTNCMWLSY